MMRTQIQLPDALYAQAKALATRREISLAELVRRGLEYMIDVSAAAAPDKPWNLPPAQRLGGADPFSADANWRADLHLSRLRVAEAPAA